MDKAELCVSLVGVVTCKVVWALPAARAIRLYYTGIKRKAGIRCYR